MDYMYSNKITLTVSDKEAFFTFDLITPQLDEKNQVSSEQIIERRNIIMSREALAKVKGLIDDCLKAENGKA